MTVEQQLAKMKQAIEKARDIRYRAELKLEDLENQKQRLLEELQELGVEPEEFDQEIERLSKEIHVSLEETWSLIPKELIEHDN